MTFTYIFLLLSWKCAYDVNRVFYLAPPFILVHCSSKLLRVRGAAFAALFLLFVFIFFKSEIFYRKLKVVSL